MSVGIYKITNLTNGKCYIGQSVHIEKRWHDEKRRAFDVTSHEYDYPRSKAFRKYGLENFTFEILEECAINLLNEKEIYYISKYNSVSPNGYNLTLGGYHSVGKKIDLTTVEEISELLKTTNMTNTEIGLLFNISENTVCGINTGYYWKRNDVDYPIRKNQHTNKHLYLFCSECGAPISSAVAELCVACAGKKRRVTERPEPKQLAQEIIENGFSAVGRKYGVSDNAIRKWCRSYNIPCTKKDLIEWLKNQ